MIWHIGVHSCPGRPGRMEQVPIAGICWRVQGHGVSRKVSGLRDPAGGLTIYSGSTLEQAALA